MDTARPAMAIHVQHLTRRFRDREAVADLTLSVPAGTVFGLLGPNGAGKTTTIRMLMGLLEADRGQVAVLGLDPLREPLLLRQRVGYVPEQHFIHRWMRVQEALRFCPTFYTRWNARREQELTRRFGLAGRQRVRELSKGMLTKLALTIALAHEPELLILDEPMAGLDPLIREELLETVLADYCEGGRTVLFSSHTIPDVQRLADRVGILHEGRLLLEESVDALVGSTKRLRAVLPNGGAPAAPPPNALWQHVNNREWSITVRDYSPAVVEQIRAANDLSHLDVVDLSLEEIFKDVIRGRRTAS